MIDAHAIIRDWILDQPAVTALTASRVYAGEDVPPPGYKPGEGDALVFRVRGGLADYDDALLVPSVQVKCYSETPKGTDTLYRAFYDACHLARSAAILHAEAEVLGQQLREPDTLWPFNLSYWIFLLRQEGD